jgi:hypothetical protein
VIRRHGRSVLLRVPAVTSTQDDPEFAGKAPLIGQWWRDHGQGWDLTFQRSGASSR